MPDMPGRDSTNSVERFDMAFQESLLRAGRIYPMNGLSRVAKPESVHVTTSLHAVQIHPHIAEVHLRLRTRSVFLRHERFHRRIARLNRDDGPACFDVLTNR